MNTGLDPVDRPSAPPEAPVTVVRAAGGPGRLAALDQDMQEAAHAARHMPDQGRWPQSDISITAYTAVVVAGSTLAAAFTAAAAWCERSPHAEVHATHTAKIPGHCDGEWEWRVVLTVSYPDPTTGEHEGDTHISTTERRSEPAAVPELPPVAPPQQGV
jgi:hypothetical protein